MSLGLPLEEMVARYIATSGEDIVSLDNLPVEFEEMLYSFTHNENMLYIEAVKQGQLFPDEAISFISRGAEALKQVYPVYERNIIYIERYDQATVCKAAALEADDRGEIPTVCEFMEQAARYLLVAYTIGEAKGAPQIKDLFICLWNSGHPDLAKAVAEASNARIIRVGSKEEEMRLVRQMGERNPDNIDSGVTVISSRLIRNAPNN